MAKRSGSVLPGGGFNKRLSLSLSKRGLAENVPQQEHAQEQVPLGNNLPPQPRDQPPSLFRNVRIIELVLGQHL